MDVLVEAAGGRRAAFEIRLCERWMADGSTNRTRLAAWSGAATRSHRHSRSSFPTDTARLQAGHRRILHRRAEAMNAVVLNDASVLAEFFVEIREAVARTGGSSPGNGTRTGKTTWRKRNPYESPLHHERRETQSMSRIGSEIFVCDRELLSGCARRQKLPKWRGSKVGDAQGIRAGASGEIHRSGGAVSQRPPSAAAPACRQAALSGDLAGRREGPVATGPSSSMSGGFPRIQPTSRTDNSVTCHHPSACTC